MINRESNMKSNDVANVVDATSERSTESIIRGIEKKNEEILALKARISLRRETIMLQLISTYTSRIREAVTLEEARFWKDILISETCFIDDAPKVKELQNEMPKYT